ncbi:MAG: Smr/MutS family protein [Ignavibacteriae bacterium]|nr:Smr/MutS family protein [Ignavibacteria bacterium]MBI3363782.1 Smr/MutS family protein [Ignavibacteriota bacterium]
MNIIYTLDIAHPPLPGAEAEAVLDEALRKAHLSSSLRVIKIIHGFGSSGKGGTLKTLVRNWMYRQRARIKSSIPGEYLTPFNPVVQELAATLDLSISKDFGAPNEGITILWVK